MAHDSSMNLSQRLALDQLQAWEALGYGLFLHFGMTTFDGVENNLGENPSTVYTPDRLDVGQWIGIARDAGMKYAILTTKHVSGHCLWPSRHTDYHVGTSGNKTDVVAEFVEACRQRGLKTGLYYCSWDNHHKLGSVTPSMTQWEYAFASREYQEFMWRQLDELMDGYGAIDEWWIDIPGVLPRDYRHRLYAHIAGRQPSSMIVMNHGISDGTILKVDYAWPTDAMVIERCLPNNVTYKPPVISHSQYQRVREVEGKRYYIPGEVCDPIGRDWFCVEDDCPRSDAELLGMYLVSRSRGANFLLDVGPDKHGLIHNQDREALMRLRKNIDKLEIHEDKK